jgi:hypothetical protein
MADLKRSRIERPIGNNFGMSDFSGRANAVAIQVAAKSTDLHQVKFLANPTRNFFFTGKGGVGKTSMSPQRLIGDGRLFSEFLSPERVHWSLWSHKTINRRRLAMKSPHPIVTSTPTDAELLHLCGQGDKDACCQIVERYQSLVCSIASNRCGELAQSEDLSQDAFILAWQKLADLKDSFGDRS